MSQEGIQILAVVPTVTAGAVLAAGGSRGLRVVDLRTPSEFAEDHLPGAVNQPLFDDVQRAIVGTLYRQASPEAAFERGRAFGRERIVELVHAIAEVAEWRVPEARLERLFDEVTEVGIARLESQLRARPLEALPERAVVLHCWRGGLRSKSVVAFVRALGLERALALEDGYKGYRLGVRAELAGFVAPPTFVLRGLTGVGKTLVLRVLERLRPGWTLDLEECAGHRSSLLGMVGLEPVGQKRFESRIATRLRTQRAGCGGAGPLVLEGESRKVGDVVIPLSVWEALAGGTNFLLEASMETRIRVLAEDYLADPSTRGLLRDQLAVLEKRMGPVKYHRVLVDLLERDAIDELVELLLERYYDPLYRGSERGRDYDATIDTSDPERAARELVELIEDRR